MGEAHGDVERTSRSYDTVAEQYAKQIAHELAGKPNVTRLKEELGTKPRVFYLT